MISPRAEKTVLSLQGKTLDELERDYGEDGLIDLYHRVLEIEALHAMKVEQAARQLRDIETLRKKLEQRRIG